MKWPDERPCKDNTAHEKGTGYTASSTCAAQVHLRERELRSFPSSCEAVVFLPQVSARFFRALYDCAILTVS